MHAPPAKLALAVSVSVTLMAAACRDDTDPPPQAGSTTTGVSDSSGEPIDLGGGDESTGPGWPLPTDDDLLTCVRTCEGPWDCCPPGTEGLCPGAMFPYNYRCIDELCVAPPCAGSEVCVVAGEQCLVIRGAPRCVMPCDDDAPCAAVGADLTCSGLDDEGSSYCFEHCTNPAVFCGNQSCDEATGECLCEGPGECQTRWECV